MELLEIDEVQSTAILDMQLRRLAALERQKIIDEYDELMAKIADYNDILANEPRQRSIVSDELAEIVDKFGDERRTDFVAWDGDVTDEDLIEEQDVVVTITSGGYAKRTKSELYRSQRRGGKGVQGAALRQDDVVEHMFVSTTHHWILFFTNKGRVYRAKAYQLPDAGRDARGQHVANLLAFQPDETIAQVLAIPDYAAATTWCSPTRRGLVKKTRLTEYDSNRQGGIIAINLADDDELISARLVVGDRRPAAGVAQGDVRAVHRRRRDAAPDGPGDQRRHRHAVPRRRLPARHGCRPTRHLRRHGHRRRVRQAHPGRRVGAEGPRNPGRACDEAGGGARLPRRGHGVRRERPAVRHRLQRRRHPHSCRRDPAQSGRDTMGVTLMNLAEGDTVVAVARGEESEGEDEDDAEPGADQVDAPADGEAGE